MERLQAVIDAKEKELANLREENEKQKTSITEMEVDVLASKTLIATLQKVTLLFSLHSDTKRKQNSKLIWQHKRRVCLPFKDNRKRSRLLKNGYKNCKSQKLI